MYYRLQTTPVLEGIYDVKNPDFDVRWLSGKPVNIVLPNPLEIELDDSFGIRMCDIFDNGILVMSDRLIKTLQQAGVDNLQLFPAILTDTKRGLRLSGYWAVQILGRVAAIDRERTEAHDPSFDEIIIDKRAAKAQSLVLFRLEEINDIIIVHESVKKELDKEKWDFVSVHLPQKLPEALDLENYACRDDWQPPIL